ncbi:MAG: hypothetical protein PVS3B3_18830 [Ktedonobacteraceae bacterium]
MSQRTTGEQRLHPGYGSEEERLYHSLYCPGYECWYCANVLGREYAQPQRRKRDEQQDERTTDSEVQA